MPASPICARHKSLIVRVNDRGPYHANREIDLSARAADLLGFRGHGIARVRVEYVGPAPLQGTDDRHADRDLARGQRPRPRRRRDDRVEPLPAEFRPAAVAIRRRAAAAGAALRSRRARWPRRVRPIRRCARAEVDARALASEALARHRSARAGRRRLARHRAARPTWRARTRGRTPIRPAGRDDASSAEVRAPPAAGPGRRSRRPSRRSPPMRRIPSRRDYRPAAASTDLRIPAENRPDAPSPVPRRLRNSELFRPLIWPKGLASSAPDRYILRWGARAEPSWPLRLIIARSSLARPARWRSAASRCPAHAQTPPPKKDDGFQTSAPYAILIDADSGTVLFEKNADKLNPPASMSKLMTTEVVLHAIARGQAQIRRRDDHQRERLAQGRRAVRRLGDVRGAQQPGERARPAARRDDPVRQRRLHRARRRHRGQRAGVRRDDEQARAGRSG